MVLATITCQEVFNVGFWKKLKQFDAVALAGDMSLTTEQTDSIILWMVKYENIAVDTLTRANLVTFIEYFAREMGHYIPVVDLEPTDEEVATFVGKLETDTDTTFEELLTMHPSAASKKLFARKKPTRRKK